MSTVAAFARQVAAGERVATPARAALAVCTEMSEAVAKPEAHRNRRLLDLAKGQPCLLSVLSVCRGERDTVVAAHSNLAIHGKAGARKANDEYSVWACWRCHQFIDQGPAPQSVKTNLFMLAHLRQVNEWREIAADSPVEADRRAARWALDHLNASPVGMESPL